MNERRSLVIDVNLTNAEVMSGLLRAIGYSVHSVTEPDDVAMALRTYRYYFCVFGTYEWPSGPDGILETIKEIRAATEFSGSILYSASPHSLQRLAESYPLARICDCILEVPVPIEMLLFSIAQAESRASERLDKKDERRATWLNSAPPRGAAAIDWICLPPSFIGRISSRRDPDEFCWPSSSSGNFRRASSNRDGFWVSLDRMFDRDRSLVQLSKEKANFCSVAVYLQRRYTDLPLEKRKGLLEGILGHFDWNRYERLECIERIIADTEMIKREFIRARRLSSGADHLATSLSIADYRFFHGIEDLLCDDIRKSISEYWSVLLDTKGQRIN